MSNERDNPLARIRNLAQEAAKGRGRRGWERSTLNSRAALRMLPWINKLISEWKPLTLGQADFKGNAGQTIYMKWNDALKWIISHPDEFPPEFHTVVCMLKSLVRVERYKDRIELIPAGQTAFDSYVPATQNRNAIATANVDLQRVVEQAKYLEKDLKSECAPYKGDWRNDFIEWLSSGEAGVPFVMKGLDLSYDEVQFVLSVCKTNDLIHEVSTTKIKVQK